MPASGLGPAGPQPGRGRASRAMQPAGTLLSLTQSDRRPHAQSKGLGGCRGAASRAARTRVSCAAFSRGNRLQALVRHILRTLSVLLIMAAHAAENGVVAPNANGTERKLENGDVPQKKSKAAEKRQKRREKKKQNKVKAVVEEPAKQQIEEVSADY